MVSLGWKEVLEGEKADEEATELPVFGMLE